MALTPPSLLVAATLALAKSVISSSCLLLAVGWKEEAAVQYPGRAGDHMVAECELSAIIELPPPEGVEV